MEVYVRLTPIQILKIRERMGLTQAQFAGLVGVTRGTVGFWERGKFCPSVEADLRIRKVGSRMATR